MSERRCPKCRRTFSGEARFCSQDGTPLVDVQPPGGPKASALVAPELANDKRAATLTHQVVDHRYQILKRLGEGGMSYVYQANDLSRGGIVAIKVLLPKLTKDRANADRLRREAGLAMRLDHPNVCRILRMGETEEGLIYLVMPFLAGELLSDRERKVGPLDPAWSVRIIREISSGLQHAHDHEIIHRDLKPENVMLVPLEDEERAVVMDFGLAKQQHAGPEVQRLTRTGVVVGTPEFMSPEQIRGKPLDPRSDVYALGVLAFEMFTGRLPFSGKNAQDVMIARLRGTPTPLREFCRHLPEPLERALSKSMAVNPADRFATAPALAEAVAEAIAAG